MNESLLLPRRDFVSQLTPMVMSLNFPQTLTTKDLFILRLTVFRDAGATNLSPNHKSL
jgi:hypothetical protein